MIHALALLALRTDPWDVVWSAVHAGAATPAVAAPAETVRWPRPLRRDVAPRAVAIPSLAASPERVWVRPGEPNALVLPLTAAQARGARVSLVVCNAFGEKVAAAQVPARAGTNRIVVPPLKGEGGYLARTDLTQGSVVRGRNEAVLSVVRNVADDLRYGFYANYGRLGDDYETRAARLAGLGINAVEFYDYFPAHGKYAPTAERYAFEPFGTRIDARDIRAKIAAGRRRSILSLAYVAAYAASESVYRAHPDPMTDARGVPKVFNGAIMPEDQADREGKPKWFWIMDVARGSAWHSYILDEFRRTLALFDGFEIDTYGDSADARFHAKGSPRDGDLLRDVLHDFVSDVQALVRRTKPEGLVSFNSVDEFAGDRMDDVTDFGFLEIWRGHTDRLEGLVDIASAHRAARRQRVVLKVYPADMATPRKAWPPDALRRVLGAAMTGGGSLMVAGEPEAGHAHALNTLYYPDNQPMAPGAEAVLRAYNAHDALMLGLTHGRDVHNTDLRPAVRDCVVRVYAAPRQRALVVQLLRTGSEGRWSVETPPSRARDVEVVLSLPGGVAPRGVAYATPDAPGLGALTPLDFQVAGGRLRTALPELRVHGTLVLRY